MTFGRWAMAAAGLAAAASALVAAGASDAVPGVTAGCPPAGAAGGDTSPHWTPDGSRLVFDRGSWETGAIEVWNTRTKRLRKIGIGLSPSWAPDARRVVFTNEVIPFRDSPSGSCGPFAENDIFIASPRTRPVDISNTIDTWEFNPAWSPAGVVAYSYTAFRESAGNAVYGIGTVKPDGSNRRTLVGETATQQLGAPTWSPGGRRLAYAGGWNGSTDIYLMNADGSETRRLTTDGASTQPAWSPAGQRIAFSNWRGSVPSIYVMDSDGSNVHRVTAGSGPNWSADGKSIVFVRTENLPTRVGGRGCAVRLNRLYVISVRRVPGRPSRSRLLLPRDKQPTEGPTAC